MTRIMMATIPHVTSGLGLRKFQADGFLLTRVYILAKDRTTRVANRVGWLLNSYRGCRGLIKH